jgi:glutamate dehydrogenase (NADP+)
MLELWKIIGPEMDVPAGDIGLGGREIAYFYGIYKKLVHEHNAVFKGKGIKRGISQSP